MKYQVMIKIISEDKKSTNTIYSDKLVTKKVAICMADIIRNIFMLLNLWNKRIS